MSKPAVPVDLDYFTTDAGRQLVTKHAEFFNEDHEIFERVGMEQAVHKIEEQADKQGFDRALLLEGAERKLLDFWWNHGCEADAELNGTAVAAFVLRDLRLALADPCPTEAHIKCEVEAHREITARYLAMRNEQRRRR